MSANTLTGLIPVIYKAMNRVMREQIGFLPAVYINADVAEAALDQPIQYPIVPAMTAAAISPAAVPSDPTGMTVSYGTMTLASAYKVPFRWSGEEEASVGQNYDTIKMDQMSQAFRVLVNAVETDLFLAAKRNASRAYGTAGTTPFATANDFTDIAQIRKILADNGAWTDDMHMVLNTTAGAKIRGTQSSLFKANEAGDSGLLRDGRLGNVEGFQFHESSQIVSHTKGTGSGYVFNGSHAVGATSVVAKTGSNTVLYGDVVTFEDDTTNKYVVNTGITAAGTMVIGNPGLRQAQTDGKTITIGNNYTGNFAFERNAIHLATRVPKLPSGGDLGEHVTVTDPFSGISFLVSRYPGYHLGIFEVALVWGVKAVNSEAIATLLG